MGLALLRANAGTLWAVWLVLWLPLTVLSALLVLLVPAGGEYWALLAWWLRPLVERSVLYVLALQVFGESTNWRKAVRAWPGQLGGGWFLLLTLWRPFMPGRGLYQAIWQLEGARGSAAAARRRVIGRDGTGNAAYWFGLACANFEIILTIGMVTFIGIFVGREDMANPFALVQMAVQGNAQTELNALVVLASGLAAAIIGPIYTACCFTLYLNRRATLEAWDIELVLRGIRVPVDKGPRTPHVRIAAGLLLLACLGLPLAPTSAQAADPPAASVSTSALCEPPEWLDNKKAPRSADHDAAQSALRAEVTRIYDSDDLRPWKCEKVWRLKKTADDKPAPNRVRPDLEPLAQALRVMLLVVLAGFLIWLMVRYRDKFAQWLPRRDTARAGEVAGLDIRPESLPDDVAIAVQALWQRGERRAALALLYRATLSRLVHQDHLPINRGATEGDCLRIAGAHSGLAAARMTVLRRVTGLWLDAAYGQRWPDETLLLTLCTDWRDAFDRPASAPATGGASLEPA